MDVLLGNKGKEFQNLRALEQRGTSAPGAVPKWSPQPEGSFAMIKGVNWKILTQNWGRALV